MRSRFIKRHECIEISPPSGTIGWGKKGPDPSVCQGSTQAPATGRYRHFKGGYYQVLALALHTETQEQLVIYQSEQDGQVYARPVAMFMEWIEHQGQVVSRFTPVA